MTEQERKAMNMALHGLLDAREVMILENNDKNAYQDEIKALRQALAQPKRASMIDSKDKIIKGLTERVNELEEKLHDAVLSEREACAKLCEKVHDDYINDRNNDGYDWPDGRNCADAIRARSQA